MHLKMLSVEVFRMQNTCSGCLDVHSSSDDNDCKYIYTEHSIDLMKDYLSTSVLNDSLVNAVL